MYGFLQPNRCSLSPTDRDAYARGYCGQCAALHSLFGYTRRALVSYDAAFLGLLVAAQQPEEARTLTSWCGVFPKRVSVDDPDSLPQRYAAGMAALIGAMKLSDAREDGPKMFFTRHAERFCAPTFVKAQEALRELRFPVELVAETLECQRRIEKADRLNITEYAEPTARFLATAFRFTAEVTGCHENEAALYEIGYHLGRLIYLADCCLDMFEDIDRDNFNGLMAAYRDDVTFLTDYSRDAVSVLAVTAMEKIRSNCQALELVRHGDVIRNILLVGFPATIHRRLERSLRHVRRKHHALLEYLPHAALASALFLCTVNQAEAAGILAWGTDVRCKDNCKLYGCDCACNERGQDCSLCDPCQCLFNPLSCYIYDYRFSRDESFNCCDFIFGHSFACIVQFPKTLLTGVFAKGYADDLKISDWVSEKIEYAILKKKNMEYYRLIERQCREREKNEKIAKLRSETLQKNVYFGDKYKKEIFYVKNNFKDHCLSYRINGEITDIIKKISTTDDEVITKRHQFAKRLDILMEELRKDVNLVTDSYSRHQTRLAQNTGRKMTIHDNLSARKLAALLAGCAPQSKPLMDTVMDDFRQTDAYSQLQQMNEYSFVTDRAKALQANIRRSAKDQSVSGIFTVYSELQQLIVLIEQSNNALFGNQKSAIHVIHNDWSRYFERMT